MILTFCRQPSRFQAGIFGRVQRSGFLLGVFGSGGATGNGLFGDRRRRGIAALLLWRN